MYDTIQDLLNAHQAASETLRAVLRNYSQSDTPSARTGAEVWQ